MPDEAATAALLPLDGKRLLDIGVGAGESVERFSGLGAKVVAIDISVAALRLVRQRVPGTQLVCADAERLPFRRGCFERVAAFSVLMFLDLEKVASEISRVSAPGAGIAFVEPTSGNPFMKVYRALTGTYRGVARWHSLADLRQNFDRLGPLEVRGYSLLPPLMAGWRLFRAFPELSRFAWIVTLTKKPN